jgi:prepilin peptidase CpaA
MILAQSLALVLLVGAAIATDLRSRRIPNGLALAALVSGLLFRLPDGGSALGWGVAAAGMAFAVGFAFYLLGGLGGGDAKLMTGLATYLDPAGLLLGFLVMAISGGLMAAVTLLRRGQVRSTVGNLGMFLVTFGKSSFQGWKGESPMQSLTRPESFAVTNPYAVAIGAGAVAGWFLPLLGWTL